MPWKIYESIKRELKDEYERNRAEKEKEKRSQRLQGIKSKGRSPRSIHSKLEQDIYRNAFLSGVIDEYEILKRFALEDMDKFIYG